MNSSPQNGPRFRILLVDDDPDIHELIAGVLGPQNIEITSAYYGDQAVETALNLPPDLILLDYELPGANGLEVLTKLRSHSILEFIPVVFITGNSDHKILTACFQAGAADYIRKPFCLPELYARVRSIWERRQMLCQLEHLASHDALTGLCNRTAIRSRLQSAINRAHNSHCAVLFLDFDRFKLVNDSLGHNIGDKLLKQIAVRLRSSLRCVDTVGMLLEQMTTARLGGDEFVVLLEGLRKSGDALIVAERLLSVLEDPYFPGGHRVCCTASIGIVNNIRSNATPEEILRDADTAMYAAKSAGKAQYALFDLAMHTNAEDRLRIENDLHVAIANEEFFLVYQPIVSLETGRADGFEALIRWRHPQRGVIPPIDFLPIAEESGLIVPIGTWVLDRACQEFASWQRFLGPDAPTKIHVNVSRKQLLRDLVEKVRLTLEKHALAPECLHLEVTEQEIMQNPEIAKATLNALRKLGVRIDMDDFGTGHSSLSCLQELPIDVLKIDRSFIANMERGRSFAALVHAVITLGQNLNMTVVAEGIETADQLAMLQFMECEEGQGYFFAKPLPADEVINYLCRPANHVSDPLKFNQLHSLVAISSTRD